MKFAIPISLLLLAGCSSQPIAAGIWFQFENPQDSRAFQINFAGRDPTFEVTDRSRWTTP